MRYFFLMLVFLLVSFGLTFSVLMSPISAEKLSLVSLVADRAGEVAGSELQVFGSLEVRYRRPPTGSALLHPDTSLGSSTKPRGQVVRLCASSMLMLA
jgi:hypothetical protein